MGVESRVFRRMVAARTFTRWSLQPPCDPARSFIYLWEPPTGTTLLERLRTEAELQSIGRARFCGSLKVRNQLWADYRNFLRQAISNFSVALDVENRSASLLYYYAMLNFAKAELLTSGTSGVLGFVSHGLQFNVTRAKTVAGDSLTVRDGVFRMLYERRTGFSLPIGTRLPVRRLLSRIPEIGEQITTLKLASSDSQALLQLLAADAEATWVLVALDRAGELGDNTATGRYFRRQFRPVDAPPDWRDRFGVSRRWRGMVFYESVRTFPFNPTGEAAAFALAQSNAWAIRDLLGLTTSATWDAWLTPSMYRTRMFPMPPSLARYAITFYASSLVRYRPAMFDSQVAPEQAYLFDALARECAIPMLIDTVSALTGIDHLFLPEGAMRL